ncbi:MAG: dihydropyrimidinase, partial [Bacteroidota bacterium]|nr:dihydropyrimidinase [Bacteroidota bacterium]
VAKIEAFAKLPGREELLGMLAATWMAPITNMNLPTPAGYSSDDFYSGSKAALHGGTTTIIDFVTPKKGEALPRALDQRIEEAEKARCNYKLHVSPINFHSETEKEIKACIDKGVNSFKVYTAYKNSIGIEDAELKQVMKVIAKYNKLLLVHSEDGDKIDRLRKQYINEGKTSPEYHPKSRPPETEADAVKKVLEMAAETQCKVYIVHVSAKESIEHIRKARQSGQTVYAETCPHYLLLNDQAYSGEFKKTAGFVLSPPLRAAGNEKNLWQAVSDSTFNTIGTDHCPFTSTQKAQGIHDFTKIPNGAGGVEHRPALLYTFGVLKNKINLNRFVELMSTQAAKIFGLYPNKGIVQEKADADLVIWNPQKKNIISKKTHRQQTDINIYEGTKTTGEAETVILNGEIVKL